MSRKKPLPWLHSSLREYALTYPSALEEFPWGHTAIKIKGKIFLSLYLTDDVLSLSVKLPVSAAEALELPYTEPTRYGLGKSGWVTASLAADTEAPLEMLREWVDESFRAVAPKKIVAQLESEPEV